MKPLTKKELPWKCDGSKEVLIDGKLYKVPEIAEMIQLTELGDLKYTYIDKMSFYTFVLQLHPYQPLESLPDDWKGRLIIFELNKDLKVLHRGYYFTNKKEVLNNAYRETAHIFYYIPPKAPGEE